VIAAGLLIACASGCGGAKNQPVRGNVQLDTGDVNSLAGSYVEALLVADPTVRASGEIQPDGSFKLATLQDGKVREGAPRGDYQVRIILTDDGPQAARQAAKIVPARYLSFESSDLTFQVPSNGEITLKLSQR
jgi:hypothetical protein